MKLLVTGGAGFIGSNFIRTILSKHPEYTVTNLDKLTYAGNLDNIADLAEQPRYHFVQGDIADADVVDKLAAKADVIVNFAAETHVDRSNTDAAPFLKTNIFGVQVLMEAALKHKHTRFIQISTDEVYGDRLEGHFTEESKLKPSNPYSASKAAAEMLVMAYGRTHQLPFIISRSSNNYGPHQYPEKIIPFFVSNLIHGNNVPLYGTGANIRDWMHVLDHCRAIDVLLHQGQLGEIYNVSANEEHSNLEVTHKMLQILGLPKNRIQLVEDRPGHDFRYAVNAEKLRALGWKPEVDFEEGFRRTVEWYKKNLNPHLHYVWNFRLHRAEEQRVTARG